MENDFTRCRFRWRVERLIGWHGRRNTHADAGLADVDSGKTDEEGERCYDFEINERFDAHSSDLLDVRVPGNSNNKR